MYCPTPRGAARVAKSSKWGTNPGTVDASFRATFGLAEMADVDSTEVRTAFKQRLTDEHEDTRAEATVGLALRGDHAVKAPLLTELAPDRVGRLAAGLQRRASARRAGPGPSQTSR